MPNRMAVLVDVLLTLVEAEQQVQGRVTEGR
jgi:hypothetical protein